MHKKFYLCVFAIFLALNCILSTEMSWANVASPTSQPKTAIVIGAGWSGLLAAARLNKVGIDVIQLEKRDQLGGVFQFSDDTNIVTVMETTELTSSRHLTQISDFPMPAEYTDFPSHWSIAKYLGSYAQHHNLREKIQFSTSVKRTEKRGDKWHVFALQKTAIGAEEEKEFIADYLVVASGLHAQPIPTPAMYEEYAKQEGVKLILNGQIKRIDPELVRHKRVLMVGGSESSSDTILQYLPFAGSMHWSIPRGQHFFKKRGKFFGDTFSLLFNNEITPFDSTSTGITTSFSPPTEGKPGMRWGCNWSTVGSINSLKGHQVPSWDNDIEFFHQFINKSADLLKYVHSGSIKPHGRVEQIDGKTVTFVDRDENGVEYRYSEEFDVIILSLGYVPKLDFLPERYQPDPYRMVSQAYHFIFDIEDPTLAFAGMIRPVITSMPILSDMSTRYIAGVWSGQLKLPSTAVMRMEQDEYCEFLDRHFEGTSRRMLTLIEPTTHSARMLDRLLTKERKDLLFQRWGETLMNEVASNFQTGSRKLHLVLDDDVTQKDFDDLREETGQIWSKNYAGRQIINYMVAVLSYGSKGVAALPTSMQHGIYRVLDGLMHALYEHDDNVYLTQNPNIRPEVIDYYEAKIVGPNNQVVNQP